MTDAELTRLFVDHATRAGDFFHDRALCRASLASHALRRGNTWRHLA